MDRIRIRGGNKLNGVINISGAKNAALPLMIIPMLTADTVTLHNVPRLADVRQLQRILQNHGVDIMTAGKRAGAAENAGETLKISAKSIVDTTAPYELVSKMRASFWVLGPLMGRMGEAKVSLPGGCAIGTRPVDLLLLAMEKLGAEMVIEQGYVIAKAKKGLKGGHIFFPKVSVGATHVALMAAVLAHGDTTIENAATEPEITDVAECLVKMGAKIEGIGTRNLNITGVTSLHGAEHTVVADRIETGTYAMLAGMAGGDVTLRGARADTLADVILTLQRAGLEITTNNEGMRVKRNGSGILPVDVTTDPYPGFPTDLQAQFMGLMTMAKGKSHIRETIFENRFMHVQELARFGADIRVNGNMAEVHGVQKLTGADVMATDLRASVSLVIAALAAEGETMLHRVYHLDRGFEDLEGKLSAVGADVTRISGA
ncbi:UDP-N-acetylglucosamine 1-carboxyvinyltransferase [Aestuariivirga litoralis]|uniref:UDP-N-acetylglucosamine 1-carboxyvinyltransferase n=1 Tax=Aestuariivirga litoralis TaxID=2650924 RepID=UPI0018C77D24|nr:UDP-N-acetylglucosamine 1-carboxyvinyltransferase [Aestuariivirga litoralis]MBG1232738.1 UDP-N-acetylglucosamine 1-carboxyvinyltransferase [Aestuariivirga litoralis]